MALMLGRNAGMLVLGVWLIFYGIAGLMPLGPLAPLLSVLALLAGILILMGR